MILIFNIKERFNRMNKFKKQFISFISCVLTVVILMSTSSTLIYATENVVSQSGEQSEMIKNNINKTEKSDEVVEDTVQKNEAKPNAESLNNNANEVNEVSNNKVSNVAEQANVNSTQEDFKIALKWGRSIRQYIYMECNKE